jgi:carboxyl-terminal processing protease
MSRSLATLLLLSTVPIFAQPCPDPAKPGLMDTALGVVSSRFTHAHERTALEERALRLLLADLDPYSAYMNAEEWAMYESSFTGSFGGVGLTLHYPSGATLPQVGLLFIGSGAAAAGVHRGDSILAIDGRPLTGLPFETILTLLRGAPGSTVRLTLQRAGAVEPLVLRVERRIVKQPTVRGFRRDAEGNSDYLLDAKDAIGYVRITMLGEETTTEVERAIASLEKRGLSGLVLDLRDTPGGMLEQAGRVADLFLDDGVIVTSVTRAGRSVVKASTGVVTRAPLVVLANDRTASSAEILIAALVDNGRATLVGQRTYGKGRIQQKIALPGTHGGVVISTGTFERPSGRTFDRHDEGMSGQAGIAPAEGMEVSVEGDELETWREQSEQLDGAFVLTTEEQRPVPDRPLERALDVLRDLRKE